MDKDNMCRIPIEATYQIVNGEPVLVKAEYRDIPADVIARFLIEKHGITPILKGGDNT